VTSATAAEQQNGPSRRQIELTDRQKDAIRIATTTRSNMFVTGPGGSVGCRVVTAADDVVHDYHIRHTPCSVLKNQKWSIPNLPDVDAAFLVAALGSPSYNTPLYVTQAVTYCTKT
jgi:hypothetical protein